MEEIDEFISEFVDKLSSNTIDVKDKARFKYLIEKQGDKVKEFLKRYNIELKDLDLYSLLGFQDDDSFQEWYDEFVAPLYAENLIETFRFYPSVRADVKKLEFEKRKTSFKDGYVFIDKPLRLFRVRLNVGGKDVFVITNKFQHLKEGNDQDLYLKVCHDKKIYSLFEMDNTNEDGTDEAKVLYQLCREYNLLNNYPKYFRERLQRLIKKHEENPIFFELAAPLKKEDLLKLNLADITWQALDAGLNKDAKLLTVFRMQIPIVIPNLELITPAEYMEHAPHTIMITSTKPGKTTTAEKVGNVLDRPTVTHLLGSASLHEKIHGLLNMENKPTIYDGIEEFKDEDVTKGMLNYMEKGRAMIARGKGVKTEGYSTLLFFSNPEKNESHARSLESLLTILHSNLLALGSRTAVFIYDPNMKEPSGDGISAELELKYNKIIEAIQFYSMPIFTKVLKHEKVKSWLRNKDDLIQEYISHLDEILADEDLLLHDKLATFINGLKRGWKHLKGGALRLAFMDLLNDFLELKENQPIPNAYISLLLNESKKYVKELIGYNQFSFTDIVSELSKDDVRGVLLESRIGKIESLCKIYEQFLLWMLAKYTEDSNPKEGIALPLSTLNELYLAIPGEVRFNSPYNSFSKFITAIENNFKVVNSHSNWLGFHLEKLDDEILCRLDDIEWLKFVAKNHVFKSNTNTIATKITNDESEGIGEIGKNGVGNENEYTSMTAHKKQKNDDAKAIILKIMERKPFPYEWNLKEIAEELEISQDDARLDYLQEILKEMVYEDKIKAINPDFTKFGIEKGGKDENDE